MNHQPFEQWLLEDEPLTSQQRRELQNHLHACTACSGIADSNLALHSQKMVDPASGFADRFRPRLAAWRREQLRRQAIGTILLVVIGVGLLYAVVGPTMLEAVRSPAAWLGHVATYAVQVMALLSVINHVGGILLKHMPAILPPGFWTAMLMAGGVLGATWFVTMRRLARSPQGVEQ
jgi:hypothetical protein